MKCQSSNKSRQITKVKTEKSTNELTSLFKASLIMLVVMISRLVELLVSGPIGIHFPVKLRN